MVKSEGVSLVHLIIVVVRDDVILVEGTLADAREDTFPDARLAFRLQWMAGFVPAIEIAGKKYSFSVRRPDGKAGLSLTINNHRVGP